METNAIIIILELVVLLFSIIIHEVAHGLMAYRLGDPTAKDAGRLTLNPVKHIDPMGSILVPLALYIFGSPALFGWAKPVPFNPYNLKNPKRDAGLIAIAGPASNFLVALIFSILLKISLVFGLTSAPVFIAFNIIVLINLVLGIFNLVPIPPLDGSKILFWLLPDSARKFERDFERYGFVILIIFIFFGFGFIEPVINWAYHLLGGSLF